MFIVPKEFNTKKEAFLIALKDETQRFENGDEMYNHIQTDMNEVIKQMKRYGCIEPLFKTLILPVSFLYEKCGTTIGHQYTELVAMLSLSISPEQALKWIHETFEDLDNSATQEA